MNTTATIENKDIVRFYNRAEQVYICFNIEELRTLTVATGGKFKTYGTKDAYESYFTRAKSPAQKEFFLDIMDNYTGKDRFSVPDMKKARAIIEEFFAE